MWKRQKNKFMEEPPLLYFKKEEAKDLLRRFSELSDDWAKAYLFCLLGLLDQNARFATPGGMDGVLRELEYTNPKVQADFAKHLARELSEVTKIHIDKYFEPEKFLDLGFRFDYARLLAASGDIDLEKIIKKWCGISSKKKICNINSYLK